MSDHSPHRARRGISLRAVLLLLPIAAAAVAIAYRPWREEIVAWFESAPQVDSSRFVLARAEAKAFRIVITENGTVDSLRNATLTNSVEGSTTIISLVPEGTMVTAPVVAEFDGVVEFVDVESESSKTVLLRSEDGQTKTYEVSVGGFRELLVTDREKVRKGDYIAGDVVCELDSSTLVEKEKQLQIAVTEARANREKAEKNLEIQISTNEGNLAKAKLAEQLAELDLEKYIAEDGEYRQLVETLQGEIKQIEEQLAIAEEDLSKVRDQARRGYTPLNNLEAARLKVTQQKIQLEVKRGELKVLEDFTYKRTVAELRQTAADSKRETERVRLEGEAALAQMKADLDARTLTLQVEEEKLDRAIRQIEACRLIAPQPGEVVYASQESRRSDPVVIEEGATVRERQAIIKLPDLSKMKIDAKIHESKISRIMVGQPVEIHVDAVSGVTYRGVLESVSSVPVPGSWPQTDLKEYEAVVAITGSGRGEGRLKPGMTAEVRIIVDDRKEPVLQIPVQAVLSVVGQFYTFVQTETGPERRELKVGDANDEFMEILDGVTEGEQVILNPRTHFSSEIAEVEATLQKAEEENRERFDVPSRSPGFGPAGGGPGAGPGGGRPGQGGPQGGGRPGGGPGGPGGGGPGGFNPQAIFERIDTNKDGVITKDESDMQGRFDSLDADSDGKVTLEEMQKGFAAARQG